MTPHPCPLNPPVKPRSNNGQTSVKPRSKPLTTASTSSALTWKMGQLRALATSVQ